MLPKQRASSVVLTLCLLHAVVADWQAAGKDGWFGAPGAEDAPNLPRLRTVIDKTDTALVRGDIDEEKASKDISDALVALWDPAWNVVVVETTFLAVLTATPSAGTGSGTTSTRVASGPTSSGRTTIASHG